MQVGSTLKHLDCISSELRNLKAGEPCIDEDGIRRVWEMTRQVAGGASAMAQPQLQAAAEEVQEILAKVLRRELAFTPSLLDALISVSHALRQAMADHAAVSAETRCGRGEPMTPLCELGRKYRTDKAPGVASHSYTPIYDELFGNTRHTVRTILEIGIGPTIYKNPPRGLLGPPPDPADPDLMQTCGASLRTLAAYFPEARVYGIDIAEDLLFSEERIHTALCDQSNREQLRRFATAHGPFDLIIDDGSHLPDHQVISFFALFDFVRPGGYYLIEDVAAKDLFCDPIYNPSETVRRLVPTTSREPVLRQVRYCANFSLNGYPFGYRNPEDDHLIVFRKAKETCHDLSDLL